MFFASQDTPPRAHCAFSLVELLAGLAVLAILALLLFPVLRSVRDHSAMTKSLGIVRQFQEANSLYALDNDGKYITVRTVDENGRVKRWLDFYAYRQYLGIPYGGEWPLELISPNAGVLDENGKPRHTRSYGMNTLGFDDWFNPGANYQATMTSLEDPVSTIAFADALDWIIADHGIKRYPGKEEYTKHAIAFRYNGKATVVFYDGHTGAYTMEEMLEHKNDWWNLHK